MGGYPGTKVRNQLRTLRFHRGEMTQQALADLSGLTRQTIIAIEQGRYAPSLEAAFRIAEALQVRIDEAFQYGPEAPDDAS